MVERGRGRPVLLLSHLGTRASQLEWQEGLLPTPAIPTLVLFYTFEGMDEEDLSFYTLPGT